jgi:hypothetical protein
LICAKPPTTFSLLMTALLRPHLSAPQLEGNLDLMVRGDSEESFEVRDDAFLA